jgi:arabinogalactan oligomer / maltooligosaccharide transport system permease protein
MPERTLFRRKDQYRQSVGAGKRLPLWKQLLLQLFCLAVALVVIYPILWVFSLSLDPRSISRPKQLMLIPQGATLQAYKAVIEKPTVNPVSLPQLMLNSLRLAIGCALASVLIAVTAAYAFSRMNFKGRQFFMLMVLMVLMIPTIAMLPALFVLLNKVVVGTPPNAFNLRNSLWGVGLAILSGMLPFAIWNLKGYIDTVPRELEEAALIDGCTPNSAFIRVILPLTTPALAVTFFLGFMSAWTEFATSWQFLTNPKDFTLIMALYNMVGQYAESTPWSKFAAMCIIIALPVVIIYLSIQRYITSGLTIGGVKG